MFTGIIIFLVLSILFLGIMIAPSVLSSRISAQEEMQGKIPREVPADSQRANKPSDPPPPEAREALERLRSRATRTSSGVRPIEGLGKGTDRRTGTNDPFV